MWKILNRLPNKDIYNKLKVKHLRRVHHFIIGENVSIRKNFYFSDNIFLKIGDGAVVGGNLSIYFDPQSKDANRHTISIGKDCHILGGVNLDCSGSIKIGDNVHIGRSVKIFTHNHVLNNPKVKIVDTNIKVEDVFIGDNVVIFDEVIIMPGSEIPNGNVVGIRSLVGHKFIEENMVLVGVPAKVLKSRLS